MSEQFEDRVSAALHTLAPPPPQAPDLFAGARRVRSRRLRVQAAAAGVALVAGGVVGVTALTGGGSPAVVQRPPAAGTEVAAPGCPNEALPDKYTPPHPGAAQRLVPGEPVVATVCRYPGLNDGGPLRHADVRKGIGDLVAALNALPAVTLSGRTYCPMDDDAHFSVYFAYADGVHVGVHLPLTGCRVATNGAYTAAVTDAVVHRLTALVDAAGAQAAAACAQVLVSTGERVSEATGQHTLALALTNTGGSPCTLHGYPTVTLLGPDGQPLPFSYARSGDQMVTADPPADVTLQPGGHAYAVVNKYRCDTGDVTPARWAEVTLPGASSGTRIAIPDGLDLAWCGEGDPGSTVHLSPVTGTLRDALRH